MLNCGPLFWMFKWLLCCGSLLPVWPGVGDESECTEDSSLPDRVVHSPMEEVHRGSRKRQVQQTRSDPPSSLRGLRFPCGPTSHGVHESHGNKNAEYDERGQRSSAAETQHCALNDGPRTNKNGYTKANDGDKPEEPAEELPHCLHLCSLLDCGIIIPPLPVSPGHKGSWRSARVWRACWRG